MQLKGKTYKLKNNRVTMLGKECIVTMTSYINYPHGAALAITVAETGEPMAVVTVNTSNPLEPDVVAIKDYAENAGVEQILIDAGVIEEDILSIIATGFETVNTHRLILELANKEEDVNEK